MTILTDEEIESCSNFSHNRYQFARAIEAAVLSKLTEQDVEPVAWREFDGEGGYDYRSYEFNESFRDEYRKRNPGRAYTDWVEPLYTEAQLLAEQQRTAEACAKLIGDKVTGALSVRLIDEQLSIAAAIRNGDWREYL